MNLTIQPTSTFTEVDGVPMRLWTGQTSKGVTVYLFVHRVAIATTDDATELEQALAEVPPPVTDRDPEKLLRKLETLRKLSNRGATPQ